MPEEKKIDEDYKEQVNKEKGKEKEGKGEPSEEQKATAEDQKKPSLEEMIATPEAKFTVLVSSVATQVLVSLGQVENPISKKKETDLESAKFSIDLLQVLADKTRGNLTDAEKRYLEGVLHKLRMCYVQASK